MAEEKKAVTADVEVVENLHAPEVYADFAHHFMGSNGNIKITFMSNRADMKAHAPRFVVIGRLTLPLNGAQGLALGLYDYLKKNGLIEEPPKDTPKH